jgi:hypothetical protein
MSVKGQINLMIENTLEPLNQTHCVVDSLPRNLDIIFGQDWLDNAPVIIPPYSEQAVKCKMSERGVCLVEHKILQPGLVCSSSLVNCEASKFPCLVFNLTDQPLCMTTDPKVEKPPAMVHKQELGNQASKTERLQLLKENLRRSYIIEGADDIMNICEEYIDIFKLPGDSLTATTAAEPTIP